MGYAILRAHNTPFLLPQGYWSLVMALCIHDTAQSKHENKIAYNRIIFQEQQKIKDICQQKCQ